MIFSQYKSTWAIPWITILPCVHYLEIKSKTHILIFTAHMAVSSFSHNSLIFCSSHVGLLWTLAADGALPGLFSLPRTFLPLPLLVLVNLAHSAFLRKAPLASLMWSTPLFQGHGPCLSLPWLSMQLHIHLRLSPPGDWLFQETHQRVSPLCSINMCWMNKWMEIFLHSHLQNK